MKLSTVLSAVLVCTPVALAIAIPPTVAEAATDAAAVLKKLDKDAAAFADVSYVSSMEIWKNGSKRKTLQFDMVMKGLDKQFITFTAPGDVAGMKILMVADELWMYSPEFQKVRKVAAHAQSQGFLGSEFTPEDMSQTNLSKLFNARLDGKSGTETTLTLTPKEGVESTFSKIELVIDSSKGGVTTLRYFDGAGNHVRTQSREGWTTIKDQPFPTTIRMKNLKTGAETVIQLTDIDVDTVVDDSLFSRRTLLRG